MENMRNNGLLALLSKLTCLKIMIMITTKKNESIKGLFSTIILNFRVPPCIPHYFTVS